MQFVIEIDDKLAQAFLDLTPKENQKSVLTAMFTEYVHNLHLQEKNQSNQENKSIQELDFVGMWANDTISVDEHMKQLRQGRQF